LQISHLATKANLELAWRRITTGGNQQYKRFFRDLYFAYEVALDENLEDLRQRLAGRIFEPQKPERIYLPKSSGLHRPLSLLHIEDQIVLQGFANLAAKCLHKKRAPLQFKVVFSNILESDTSIFFFRRWQETYAAFQRKIAKHYDSGMRWVADFDLAAFYDTVSHELLMKTIYPRTATSDDMKWFLNCLLTWSSEKAASLHRHGLPQGPLASDFLAECFLLPIDLSLKSYNGYTRYVDDVRLFGRTEDEVRAAVIKLERRCRERGLIPQSGKFSIKRAQSVEDAMGMLPSIADPQRTERTESGAIPIAQARRVFLSSIGGKPYRVTDKTRLRYVLYRAEPDSHILKLVLKLLPHHPEHADAFFNYLAFFGFRKPILQICLNLVVKSPYPFVRGEAWHVLARYLQTPIALDVAVRGDLKSRAISIAKDRRSEYIMEKWGACHFLAVLEAISGTHLSRFLWYQPALLQSLLANILPDRALGAGEAADYYLRRSTFEPGLSICGRIHGLGLTLGTFGLADSELPSQVRNTLCQLGVIPNRGASVDPIGEILQARYRLSPAKPWHALLGVEYVYALGLLKEAEASFESGRSFWLACQNTFNHAIFLALQRYLALIGHPLTCTTKNKLGQLVEYGVLLDRNGRFSKRCPEIADVFRDMNDRRNCLPVSHPYEKKTAIRCRYLKAKERNQFVQRLLSAYQAFAALMP